MADVAFPARTLSGPAAPSWGWWDRNKSRLVPYAFIAPNLALFCVFIFFPLFYALYISLHEWSLIGDAEYVGGANYRRIVSDGLFWRALGNTAMYSLATVPTSLVLGLLLAVALNRDLAGRTVLRSVFFLPVVVSNVAAAIIVAWLFNDNYGVTNAVLKTLGFGPVPWLSSPSYALPSLVIATLWIRLGFCMIVYLAALQSIPPNLYEAARIDGATRLQQFRFITVPMLAPATFLLLILNVIYSFQVFDLIYVMTGGGPGFSTTMIVQYIYTAAFVTSEMGYASAMGLVLFGIILVFTLVQWRVSRQAESTM